MDIRSKTLVIDFDDTLVRTQCRVRVDRANGTRWWLSTERYAAFTPEATDLLDFREFETLRRPTPILHRVALLRAAMVKGWDAYVCTAREARRPVERFLKRFHLEPGIVNLGSSNAALKAVVVKELLDYGTTRLLFVDDAVKNVQAVAALKVQYPYASIRAVLAR